MNMGKIKDLFYKITRGSEALKPNDLGPAKKLNLAAKQESVPVKVVPATVGTNPGCACGGSCACGGKKKTVTNVELKAHLEGEGIIAPTKKVSAAEKEATVAAKKAAKPDAYVAEVKKQAVKKAPIPRDGDGDGKINDGKKNEAKAPVKKPVSKSQEKRVAIQKDAADTPVAKKPAPKKK